MFVQLTPEQAKLMGKLHAVMAAVERLEKDKANKEVGGGYRYLSEEKIKTALHQQFVEKKLTFAPVGCKFVDGRPGASGKQIILSFEFRWLICDVESGAGLIVESPGSGADSNDKGTYKAFTGALKYALTGSLLIPTGDDPEKDDPRQRELKQPRPAEPTEGEPQPRQRRDPEAQITEPQRRRMYALANGVPADEVKAIMRNYGYEHSAEVKAKHYDDICAAIQERKAALAP